ncbi:class I SAM-dependent methyltransferase, partial [Streptomyces violaceorubidus]|uniref:class I SAM-dependent methyltransferase n=1 Tax=Streptomyces violaceorubidus TaxID=284042 RepID=UPI0004C2A733
MSKMSPREVALQAEFDAFYTATASSDLLPRLHAEALGDACPSEVEAYSSCNWNLLGTALSRLRMRPGQLLADIGCGTGGVGLWLARALAVNLVGVDLSRTAVELAMARRSDFVPPERARFQVGTVRATGLSDQCAQGAICVDVVVGTAEWAATLQELHRILEPGSRAVLTRTVRAGSGTVWKPQVENAGFEIEDVCERPEEPQIWRSLYHLWISRERELRRALGDALADTLLKEAREVLPRLGRHRSSLVTLRRRAT